MRISRINREAADSTVIDPPPVYLDARIEFAARYLAGHGLEIGGLNWPLQVPPEAHVSQVDRMSTEQLREEYPEVADGGLPEVDIVDDGEALTTIPEGSQDFIIANHFLEHTEDPIGTIGTHLSKLKPGGVLFYAVPDKRYSFDFRRPITPLGHMIRDHEKGPQRSRRQHFDEWTRLVGGLESDRADTASLKRFEKRAKEEARKLEAASFSIHTHVWNQASFLGLILHCRERFGEAFDIEATCQRSLEFVVVLRKRGAWPEPPLQSEPAATTIEPVANGSSRQRRSLAQRLRAALRTGGQAP